MNFNKYLLPNSIHFGTLPLGEDLIAALFGLSKKHRELVIMKDPRVSTANNYMLKQYKRLEKAAIADDIKTFERISDVILRKSKVYQYVGMHRTQNGWFWQLKSCRIRAIMRKLQHICLHRSGKVDYERVWIPKGDDQYGRPLGVPKIEWRIWSWMNLNIMEIWCESRGLKPKWQHGGMSGRGVVTAWKDLIPKLDEENILEFDIKGFFNNISHSAIEKFIRDSKLNSFSKWVKETLESKPTRQNAPPLELERKEFKDKASIYNAFTYNEEFTTAKWMEEEDPAYVKEVQAFAEKHGLEMDWRLLGEEYNRQDVIDQRNKHFNLDQPGKGVPQGLGTSPYLSVMTLGNILKIPGLIMYMDDGIITAKTEDELMTRFGDLQHELGLAGLELAMNKTFVNKRNGIWEKPLKFLGLLYQPEMDWIRSETRNGNALQFPRAEMLKDLDKLWYAGNSGKIETMKKVLGNTAHKVALEYGLLGLFISKVFAPDMKVSERELIEIGINEAYSGMKNNRNTFIFDNRDAWHHIADHPAEVVTTASTRMIKLILEEGFLARRIRA